MVAKIGERKEGKRWREGGKESSKHSNKVVMKNGRKLAKSGR